MQTEADATNGHAELIPQATGYDFTAPNDTIPLHVRNGDRQFIFYAVLRKRTLSDLLAREKDAKHESEQVARNESIVRDDEQAANANLFDRVIESGAREEVGVENSRRELTAEQCLKFTQENKAKFILRAYRLKSEVVEVSGADEDDFMFETAGEMIVRQKVGDPLSPDFVIEYTFTRPPQSQRDAYNRTTQVRQTRRGDKQAHRIVTDLERGYRIALAHFKSVSGAIGEGKDIDALFLTDAFDTAVAYHNRTDEGF